MREQGFNHSESITLSVAIITYNEENIIARTIAAAQDVADEIVVVDSFSTDRTADIAKSLGAKVIQRSWRGFSSQKNFAINECNSDWILSLDADEVISPALANEIRYIIQNPAESRSFRVSRKWYIGNVFLKYGGHFPDYQLRLFKKTSGAKFKNRAVHESITVDGSIADLKYPLDHYAYRSVEDYDAALQRYAKLASREIKKGIYYLPTLRAAWKLFYRSLIQLGILDGVLGLKMVLSFARYTYWKYEYARLEEQKISSPASVKALPLKR
ncbi:MAG: glycosyl transferase [Waddliaceae bacterium]|nr:glycosyl transferase [Waddliaceae bacterium]